MRDEGWHRGLDVALGVADFAGALERLRAAGVEVRGPDRRGDGSGILFCRDFDA